MSDRTFRVPPIVALGVGVLLWYLPTYGRPIAEAVASTYAGRFVAELVLRWVALALLLVFVFAVERRPAGSVGIRSFRWTHVLVTIGLSIVTVVVSYGIYFELQGDQVDESTQTGQIITSLPFIQLVHLVVNAAVVEEFFYRGFLIERLVDLTKRPWIAGAISYLLFVGGHIPGSGLTATLALSGIATLTFVGLYLWRRSIWLPVLAHAICDAPILLAG
ncbi:MAG TPA: type II CAAX endopeptidase family protein [Actinopolymorphaceae bacterium]